MYKLIKYLSVFLIQISLIAGISAILLGNDDGIGGGLGQQITYAQLTTSSNGYPEGHPLAPPQGYPEGYSEIFLIHRYRLTSLKHRLIHKYRLTSLKHRLIHKYPP